MMRQNANAAFLEPKISDFLAEAEKAPPIKTRVELIGEVLAQAKAGIMTLHKKGYNAKHIADMVNAQLPASYPKLSAKIVRESIGLRPEPRKVNVT